MPDAKRKEKIKSQNPLRVPEMYGWVRRLAKQKGSGRRHVVYQAPCGRSLVRIHIYPLHTLMQNTTLTGTFHTHIEQLSSNIIRLL